MGGSNSKKSIHQDRVLTSNVLPEEKSIGTPITDDIMMRFYRDLIDIYPIKLTRVEMEEKVRDLGKYVCKVPTMLVNNFQYIIVISKIVCNIGEEVPLSQLIKGMKSFQTRTTDRDIYSFVPSRGTSKDIRESKEKALSDIIHLQKTSNNFSTYLSEKYPIKIQMLHKGKTKNEYPETSKIIFGLETFNCILEFET